MKETKEIIIIGDAAYQRLPGTWVIPHSEKNKVRNENETVIDSLRRIQLSESIMKKMNMKTGDKLDVYLSGKNIILKKLKAEKSSSEVNTMIIDNKYEVKVEINSLDFGNCHKIVTVDERGKVLIGHDILKKAGFVENDILRMCIKDNMLILIQKEKDKYKNKKRNFSNNRRRYK